MERCFWCHRETEPYAFDLCLSCYRWFHRHKDSPVEYCDLCQKVVTKRQKGICRECRIALEAGVKIPKRIERLKDKYEPVKSLLDSYDSVDKARAGLGIWFKDKEDHLVNVLIDRYYNRKTLDEIGKKERVTREYIRQCENKAISILKERPYALDD